MKNRTLNELSLLALRLMGSLIFITAGFNHLFQTSQAAARLDKAKLGFLATTMASPELLVILSGIGLLAGGFSLLAGFQTRLSALGLLFILIPITITMQMGSAATMGPLFKNIAIMGILVFFIANGAVSYGLDQFLERKKTVGQKAGKVITAAAILLAGFTGFTSCSPAAALAPSSPQPELVKASPSRNYGILISQPDHLKAAVHTAQTLRQEGKYKAGKIVVMACGKSVEAFKKDSKMKEFLEAGKTAGVTFRVCGMSLNKFQIAPEDLLPEATVVPNGLTYMFDLKLDGYETVEL